MYITEHERGRIYITGLEDGSSYNMAKIYDFARQGEALLHFTFCPQNNFAFKKRRKISGT
jgi:hypothetical protein